MCVAHDIYSWPTVRRAIAELLLDEPIRGKFRFGVLQGSDGLGIFYKVRETVAIGIGIQDRESKNPIAGATVYVKDKTRIISTDANGKIYLHGIRPGNYHVTVKAEGYESIDDRFVHIDNGRRFQEVIVEMKKK